MSGGGEIGLVLASSSPRRRQLLPLLGIPFEVVEPRVVERSEGDPAEVVVDNAVQKARSGVELSADGAIVIGSDTDVVIDGRVVGKPEDAAAAELRLRSLSGRSHEVLSGVAVARGERIVTGLERTVVGFRELDPDSIERYVRSGEWEGRAGGYAVQGLGSALVARVDGDLSNVIGLPVSLVGELVERLQCCL